MMFWAAARACCCCCAAGTSAAWRADAIAGTDMAATEAVDTFTNDLLDICFSFIVGYGLISASLSLACALPALGGLLLLSHPAELLQLFLGEARHLGPVARNLLHFGRPCRRAFFAEEIRRHEAAAVDHYLLENGSGLYGLDGESVLTRSPGDVEAFHRIDYPGCDSGIIDRIDVLRLLVEAAVEVDLLGGTAVYAGGDTVAFAACESESGVEDEMDIDALDIRTNLPPVSATATVGDLVDTLNAVIGALHKETQETP